jgi:hypothetical protein
MDLAVSSVSFHWNLKDGKFSMEKNKQQNDDNTV